MGHIMKNNRYIYLFFSVLLISGLLYCSSRNEADKKNAAPAKIDNPVKESELTTITLIEAAKKRLGIQTVRMEYREIERTRLYGGEIIAAPGHSVIISAPLPGIRWSRQRKSGCPMSRRLGRCSLAWTACCR